MELKCLKTYSCPDFTMEPDATTVDKNLTDERKEQMLADYPGSFEVVGKEAEEAPVETEEEKVGKKKGK